MTYVIKEFMGTILVKTVNWEKLLDTVVVDHGVLND